MDADRDRMMALAKCAWEVNLSSVQVRSCVVCSLMGEVSDVCGEGNDGGMGARGGARCECSRRFLSNAGLLAFQVEDMGKVDESITGCSFCDQRHCTVVKFRHALCLSPHGQSSGFSTWRPSIDRLKRHVGLYAQRNNRMAARWVAMQFVSESLQRCSQQSCFFLSRSGRTCCRRNFKVATNINFTSNAHVSIKSHR